MILEWFLSFEFSNLVFKKKKQKTDDKKIELIYVTSSIIYRP